MTQRIKFYQEKQHYHIEGINEAGVSYHIKIDKKEDLYKTCDIWIDDIYLNDPENIYSGEQAHFTKMADFFNTDTDTVLMSYIDNKIVKKEPLNNIALLSIIDWAALNFKQINYAFPFLAKAINHFSTKTHFKNKFIADGIASKLSNLASIPHQNLNISLLNDNVKRIFLRMSFIKADSILKILSAKPALTLDEVENLIKNKFSFDVMNKITYDYPHFQEHVLKIYLTKEIKGMPQLSASNRLFLRKMQYKEMFFVSCLEKMDKTKNSAIFIKNFDFIFNPNQSNEHVALCCFNHLMNKIDHKVLYHQESFLAPLNTFIENKWFDLSKEVIKLLKKSPPQNPVHTDDFNQKVRKFEALMEKKELQVNNLTQRGMKIL